MPFFFKYGEYSFDKLGFD